MSTITAPATSPATIPATVPAQRPAAAPASAPQQPTDSVTLGQSDPGTGLMDPKKMRGVVGPTAAPAADGPKSTVVFQQPVRPKGELPASLREARGADGKPLVNADGSLDLNRIRPEDVNKLSPEDRQKFFASLQGQHVMFSRNRPAPFDHLNNQFGKGEASHLLAAHLADQDPSGKTIAGVAAVAPFALKEGGGKSSWSDKLYQQAGDNFDHVVKERDALEKERAKVPGYVKDRIGMSKDLAEVSEGYLTTRANRKDPKEAARKLIERAGKGVDDGQLSPLDRGLVGGSIVAGLANSDIDMSQKGLLTSIVADLASLVPGGRLLQNGAYKLATRIVGDNIGGGRRGAAEALYNEYNNMLAHLKETGQLQGYSDIMHGMQLGLSNNGYNVLSRK